MKKFESFCEEVDDVRILCECGYEDDGRSLEDQLEERKEYVASKYVTFLVALDDDFDFPDFEDEDDFDAWYGELEEKLEKNLRKIENFVRA